MGLGVGKGENRTIDAIRQAVYSPLLETTIEGATGVIINITGGLDLTMNEVQYAVSLVQQVVDPEAGIIFGADIRENIDDEVQVTIIATGFDAKNEIKPGAQDKGFFGTKDEPPAKTLYGSKFDNYSNSADENLNLFGGAKTAPQNNNNPFAQKQAPQQSKSPFGNIPTGSPFQQQQTAQPQRTDRVNPFPQQKEEPHKDDDNDNIPPFLRKLRGNKK